MWYKSFLETSPHTSQRNKRIDVSPKVNHNRSNVLQTSNTPIRQNMSRWYEAVSSSYNNIEDRNDSRSIFKRGMDDKQKSLLNDFKNFTRKGTQSEKKNAFIGASRENRREQAKSIVLDNNSSIERISRRDNGTHRHYNARPSGQENNEYLKIKLENIERMPSNHRGKCIYTQTLCYKLISNFI